MQPRIQIITTAVEPEWEPALGEFGWLWITLIGLAVFTSFKLVQRNREQERARIEHEKTWGQRDGESTEDWKSRVKLQEEEIEKWKLDREIRVKRSIEQASNRRSRGSAYNSRGDFDPPGGWGGMGPG